MAVDPRAAARLALRLGDSPEPALDPEFHHFGDEASTLAYTLTLDAINFGSGWFPLLRRRDGRSGYFHVARALKERFDRHGPWSAAELAALTPGEVAAVMGQPAAGGAFELMRLFAVALNALGAHLVDHHAGRFEALVDAAEGDAEALVGLLAGVPLFDDVHEWRGLSVPIYKRAQIAASDLDLALGGRGRGRLAGLDRLTLFADNLVPHVLRIDGVLDFAPGLAGRVDGGELLEPGSEEEVEMRACAIHAVELMVAAARAAGRPESARRLDTVLWNRGQSALYKSSPRPRCRCVYY